MIYITGDTHGKFEYRFKNLPLSKNDMIIILGDAGINYYLDERDRILKEKLSKYSFKIFSIQGNHEERPENISTYIKTTMFGGDVFMEEEYPNLVFAKNGELYNFNGKSVLVIGGAFSVDKYHRLKYKLPYFKDEQLSKKEQKYILKKHTNTSIDTILSHTCPLKYIPTEAFIGGIDQNKVDNSMEKFLDLVEENISYNKWYCGHYHIGKSVDNLEFIYTRIKDFETDEFISTDKVKILKK